jgi:hypothetical protein
MSLELLFILVFAFVAMLGFVVILNRFRKCRALLNFATEYRNNFVEFANSYLATYNHSYEQSVFKSDLYTWLTMRVNQIQADMGGIGTLYYIAPFRAYHVENYQIVLNTLPKFRLGKVDDFDINSSDDCLIRYIGFLEQEIGRVGNQLKNPIIWFKVGFQEVMTLPLYIFNWFGILSDRAVVKVTHNIIYRVLSGLSGLVTFISGIVTIIQGKDQTIALFRQVFIL